MKNNYPYIRSIGFPRQSAGSFSRTLFPFFVLKGSSITYLRASMLACIVFSHCVVHSSEFSKQATKKRVATDELAQPSLEKKSKSVQEAPEIVIRHRKRVVEYAPEFPLLKNLAEGPANMQAIAVYLTLQKDGIEDQGAMEHFLAAVQGSSFALFGMPFFEADAHCNSMKLAAITWGEEDFSSAHRLHVETLSALMKLKAFQDIPDDEQLAIAYFRQPKVWIEYLLLRLEQAKTSDDISLLIGTMRNYVSYRCLTPEDLSYLKERCLYHRESIDRVVGLWTSLTRIKWAHQNSSFEAFMGHLFFPIPCECLFETTARLRLRGHLQDLLAYSASCGNLLATVHLTHILAGYDPHADDSMKDVVSVYCDKATVKHIEGSTKKPSSKKNMPYYLCGLLCIERNKNRQAQDHFKRGHEEGDGWCTYRYALGVKEPQKRSALVEVLRQREPGLALLMEAKSVKDSQDRIRLLCEAGKAGIAEGYMSAGLLAQALKDEAAYDYFLLAGQKYLLSGYEEVAALLLQEGDLEEMKEAYRLQGQWGEPNGSIQLAAQLWKENKTDEAVSSAEQGGVSGYDKLLELEPSEKKRKVIVKKRSELQRTRFAQLKGSIVHDD